MSHYVYKYVNNGEIIYIGKCDSKLIQRINQHKAEDKFKPYLDTCKIYYAVLANATMSDVVESELINKYKPRLNIAKMSEWAGLGFEEPKWVEYAEGDFEPLKLQFNKGVSVSEKERSLSLLSSLVVSPSKREDRERKDVIANKYLVDYIIPGLLKCIQEGVYKETDSEYLCTIQIPFSDTAYSHFTLPYILSNNEDRVNLCHHCEGKHTEESWILSFGLLKRVKLLDGMENYPDDLESLLALAQNCAIKTIKELETTLSRYTKYRNLSSANIQKRLLKSQYMGYKYIPMMLKYAKKNQNVSKIPLKLSNPAIEINFLEKIVLVHDDGCIINTLPLFKKVSMLGDTVYFHIDMESMYKDWFGVEMGIVSSLEYALNQYRSYITDLRNALNDKVANKNNRIIATKNSGEVVTC